MNNAWKRKKRKPNDYCEKEKAEREAAEALKRKEVDAKNKAKDLNAVKLDGDAGKDGRYTWSYANV